MSNNKKKWTDDEVANLIQLYEEHEFLWNVKHTLYRNREKKMSMFDEFATKFKNCDSA
jgi:Alcohol dehydrogenase transcription factor Myb/SANT-like.